MNKPNNGVYVAKVTDNEVQTFHADENTVADAQTEKIFTERNKNRANQEQDAADKLRDAENQLRKSDRQAAAKSRRRWYTAKDCAGLIGTAVLVYCTYRFGQLVAIGAVVGCLVAAACRITNHIENERSKNND